MIARRQAKFFIYKDSYETLEQEVNDFIRSLEIPDVEIVRMGTGEVLVIYLKFDETKQKQLLHNTQQVRQ